MGMGAGLAGSRILYMKRTSSLRRQMYFLTAATDRSQGTALGAGGWGRGGLKRRRGAIVGMRSLPHQTHTEPQGVLEREGETESGERREQSSD